MTSGRFYALYIWEKCFLMELLGISFVWVLGGQVWRFVVNLNTIKGIRCVKLNVIGFFGPYFARIVQK
jgi:hypothetical protein